MPDTAPGARVSKPAVSEGCQPAALKLSSLLRAGGVLPIGSNVPEKVWSYTIGGYQVIKKWLSYREFERLGRPITPDEAREVTHTARRIAALILLQPELDQNYQAVKSTPVSFPVS